MVFSRFVLLISAAITAGACTAQPQSTADATPAPQGAAPALNPVAPGAQPGDLTVASHHAEKPVTGPSVDPDALRLPVAREVTIPAGTTLSLQLGTAISSKDSAVEDPVQATLRRAIVVDGETVIPAGATVSGHVTQSTRSGRVKGLAEVAVQFSSLRVGDTRYGIRTAAITRQAEATKKEDATKIGIGAGAGAITGAIAGGKKGAAIGTAVGAGGGTAVVLATRGEDVTLPRGTVVTARLIEPVTLRVH